MKRGIMTRSHRSLLFQIQCKRCVNQYDKIDLLYLTWKYYFTIIIKIITGNFVNKLQTTLMLLT